MGEEIVRARREEGGGLIRTDKCHEGVVCRATGTGKEEREGRSIANHWREMTDERVQVQQERKEHNVKKAI